MMSARSERSRPQEFDSLALYVNGEWRSAAGRQSLHVVDPCTEDVLGELPVATDRDIDDALDAAKNGFAEWSETPAITRSRVILAAVDLIKARSDSIARVIAFEQGKPIGEAKQEVLRAADMIQFCAEEARRLYGRIIPSRERSVHQYVTKEPVGPIAGFTPWNYPAVSPARKIGGALAAGCSLVLKPSEEVPASALALARAFHDVGLPRGVLNVLFGDPAHISRRLIESPVIRKVTLTGSTQVGKTLAALAGHNSKPSVMELGGHAPVIVCEDADPAAAASASVTAKFRNAGQVCVSPTRFYISRSLYKDFCDRFASAAAKIKVGSPFDAEVTMGPLVNGRRRDAIDRLVLDAKAKGARVLSGGERVGNRGYFYAPTVLSDVPTGALAMQEEPFGPIALLCPFEDLEDAIDQANSLPFGLASYAFTQSARTADLLARRLCSGVVGINRFGIAEPETPFGGVKDSGFGREGGIEGLDSYLTTKFVAHAL